MKSKSPFPIPTEIEGLFRMLKMNSACERYRAIWAEPKYESWSFDEKLELMLREEVNARSERRTLRHLQHSGLKESEAFHSADLNNLINRSGRNINIDLLNRLGTCAWILNEPPSNLLISGATGTGKTWIVTALGKAACHAGISTYYYRVPKLLEIMQDAYDHHRSSELRVKINRNKLLILDDFGMGTLSQEVATDLLSLLVDRVGFASTIVAGQLDPSEWYGYIGNDHTAEALIDRLVNTSYRINLQGKSLREGQAPT